MMNESKLRPGFAATTLYENFEEFIAHYAHINCWRRFDPLPIQMLVRLARNDFPKARRVYDWAVRVPLLRQLDGWYREHDETKVTLSENGLKQAEAAAARFGQNPAFALTMLEGIFILESTAAWAEQKLANNQPPTTLDALRTRPENPKEEMGRVPWLHQLYEDAYERVSYNLRNYVEARNTAIMLSITALADGCPPTEDEIRRALRGKLHSRKSAKEQRTIHDPRKDWTISDSHYTVEWVLGKNQKEIAF